MKIKQNRRNSMTLTIFKKGCNLQQVTTGDDEGYSTIELQIRKADTPLKAPLPTQAMKILNDQRELQPEGEDFVFPWCSDKPEARIRNKSANVMLKQWAKDVGLGKRLHFHMARHTFATMTLEHGAELYTVSKLLGHSKITTTTIYAKVVDDMKQKAVMGLPTL